MGPKVAGTFDGFSSATAGALRFEVVTSSPTGLIAASFAFDSLHISNFCPGASVRMESSTGTNLGERRFAILPCMAGASRSTSRLFVDFSGQASSNFTVTAGLIDAALATPGQSEVMINLVPRGGRTIQVSPTAKYPLFVDIRTTRSFVSGLAYAKVYNYRTPGCSPISTTMIGDSATTYSVFLSCPDEIIFIQWDVPLDAAAESVYFTARETNTALVNWDWSAQNSDKSIDFPSAGNAMYVQNFVICDYPS